MEQLFRIMMALLEQGQSLVLVTIIAGQGSAPRGAGARMLVREDGSTYGTIGGGAVEYRAGLQAVEVLKEKKSCTRGYRLTKDEVAGIGMICGGNVVIYFQYVDGTDEAFKALGSQILKACKRDEDSWLLTDITEETAWDMGLYSERTGLVGMKTNTLETAGSLFANQAVTVTVGEKKYYSEPLIRAGKVYIFGGGHVAQELVPVLSHLEFSCVVYDDREEFANQAVFPQAKQTILADFEDISRQITVTKRDYLIIMTRGHQFDYLLQKQVLHTPAGYIGVMGSRNKKKLIRDKLKEEGFTDKDIERFHTPIGLAISAETPAEIAISIAGELIQERANSYAV